MARRSHVVRNVLVAGLVAGAVLWQCRPSHRSARAPVSVVIVIDRWQSASVGPDAAGDYPATASAKVALAALDKLDDGDAFALLVYARAGGYTQELSCSETRIGIARATAANKAAARAAIVPHDREPETAEEYFASLLAPRNEPYPTTSCIHRGLLHGAAELARSPVGGARRIIVVSDGGGRIHVAEPVLAATLSAQAIAISTISLEANPEDGAAMRTLALRGGTFHEVDTRGLAAALARELHAARD